MKVQETSDGHSRRRRRGSSSRLKGNSSIASDAEHHRLRPQGNMKGGGRFHEFQIRREQGLKANQFHSSHKREMDIVQGSLRKSGIPASVVRRLRKDADLFYRALLKQNKKAIYKP